jgi:hypothetical protein
MGYLLPILAQLIKDHEAKDILDPDPESNKTKLFRFIIHITTDLQFMHRSVWFYCVLFRFVERGEWRSDWFECVKQIGYRIPVLIAKKLTYYTQIEIEIESLLTSSGFGNKVGM